MNEKRYNTLEDYDRQFLLNSYDTLSSEPFKRYVLPLIWGRINMLEDKIIKEDTMDEQYRYARLELLKVVSLSAQVKSTLEAGQENELTSLPQNG